MAERELGYAQELVNYLHSLPLLSLCYGTIITFFFTQRPTSLGHMPYAFDYNHTPISIFRQSSLIR